MRRIHQLICGVVLSVAPMAVADPGTYVGTGTYSMGGAARQDYSATLIIREVGPHVMEVVESYQMASGQEMQNTSTFHFSEDGSIKVEKNGVKIGCGYCVARGDNKWCDYRVQTDQGMLHVNMYYDSAQKTIHRMGDAVQVNGIMLWNDELRLQTSR